MTEIKRSGMTLAWPFLEILNQSGGLQQIAGRQTFREAAIDAGHEFARFCAVAAIP
jgi:hypothetical protein